MTRIPDRELALRTAYRKEHGSEAGFVPPPRVRRKRDNEEFRIQSAFVKLWRANCGKLGIAQCLGFHCPNGSVMGGGKAEWQVKERQIRGTLQKLAGVEPGVLDWMLLVPSGRWHALLLEFKKPGATTSEAQELFIGYATARGYRCEIHTDAQEAWRAVMRYLSLPVVGSFARSIKNPLLLEVLP